MEESNILSKLKSRTPNIIIETLSEVKTILKNNDVKDDALINIFVSVSQFITSPHVKIQLQAIFIVTNIIQNHSQLVEKNIYNIFPQILNILSSDNKILIDRSLKCLQIIFSSSSNQNEILNKFSKTFANIPSFDNKISVINQLQNLILNKNFPLIFIFKVVEDPNFQVQETALNLIAKMNYHDIENGINNASNIEDTSKVKILKVFNIEYKHPKQKQSFNQTPKVNETKNSKKGEATKRHLTKIEVTPVFHKNIQNIPPDNKLKSNIAFSKESQNYSKVKSENILKSKTPVLNKQTKRSNLQFSTPAFNSCKSQKTPIGKLIETIKIAIPYNKNDIKHMDWSQRYDFLKMIKDIYIDKNQKAENSPFEIFDCILQAITPLHPVVVFFMPPIFKRLIMYNPEILVNQRRLTKLLKYTLQAMILEEWKINKEFNDYLSALFIESDPLKLIETSIQITNQSDITIPFELFIMKIYVYQPDLILPYNILSHLICCFTHLYPLNSSQSELFLYICQKQYDLVHKYSNNQSYENREIIESFLNKVDNSSTNYQQFNLPKDNKNLLAIIRKSFSEGPKCNFLKCLSAMNEYSEILNCDIFFEFLKLVSKIPQNTINNNNQILTSVCLKHFGSPKLIEFLGLKQIPTYLLSGLANVIWHSPSTILKGSQHYLKNLYETFIVSKGPTRSDIIILFLAINHVTGYSITCFKEVAEPYRNLISNMMKQYKIV